MENYFFLKNYNTSEGAASHTVLIYQPLPITCYQLMFYANNYLEYLPIVSTTFKDSFKSNVPLQSYSSSPLTQLLYSLHTNVLSMQTEWPQSNLLSTEHIIESVI